MSIIDQAHFKDEAAAYRWVEARVWPEGPVCPHCGAGKDRVGVLKGKSTRIGVYKCYACRKPFTVKVGTIFEDSHVKLHIWLQAMFLLCSSKKGISANQLHRTLGVTLKTAWFMAHRIREAMRTDGPLEPMGGNGKIVEVDETYWGDDPTKIRGKSGPGHKFRVLALVERGGQARSMVVKDMQMATLLPILRTNIAHETHVMTDEAPYFNRLTFMFKRHDVVNHGAGEYMRGPIGTNTVEGYFGVFKRGMRGTYQHCEGKHLHRYVAEFEFRYSSRAALGINDEQRTDHAIRGIVGKRLTYRRTHSEGTA